jgi:hypothetical protein
MLALIGPGGTVVGSAAFLNPLRLQAMRRDRMAAVAISPRSGLGSAADPPDQLAPLPDRAKAHSVLAEILNVRQRQWPRIAVAPIWK